MAQELSSANIRLYRGILAEIEKEDGVLTPRRVWEAARPPEHPMHAHFEWDDSEAAAKYRDEQARRLITTIIVAPDMKDESLATGTPLFVRCPVSEPNDPGYVSIGRCKSDAQMGAGLLEQELARLAAAADRVVRVAQGLGSSLAPTLRRLHRSIMRLVDQKADKAAA